MIQIENMNLQFGDRFLFKGQSTVIKDRDRVGLVGKNGAGKSTLLKILMGEIKADSGQIVTPNGIQYGYLPQELDRTYNLTIYEEAATAYAEIKILEKRAEEIQTEMEAATDFESKAYFNLIQEQSDTQERLLRLGGLNMREQVEKILKGLGFVDGDFDRPMTEFSGGWKMRVELAKLLLQEPHYLLLDEPTNHLDIESIIWLESFLLDYPGGIVLISHDQRFLDQVCNRTLEIVNGKFYDYKVPYTKFLDLRVERQLAQIEEKKRQDKFIEETKVLINKFRAKKNKAAFAQTLITKLERLEIIEVDEMENSSLNIRFPQPPRSGKVVIKTDGLRKSYGDLNVLNGVDLELERGEKVAFVGKNGEGKSTFSKILVGQEGYEGTLEIGHNVTIGYFAQNQAETLDGKKTVFETIDDVATGDMRNKVRGLLGSFLFSGEDVDKKVMVLSGGEKSRLAMAKLLLDPVSLLVLDEPTNHLDIRSKDLLRQALQNFEGTLVVVSHDREFLKGLTTKIFEFKNRNIKMHHGDIYDFLNSKKIEFLDDLGMKSTIQRKKEVVKSKVQDKEQRLQLRELEKSIKRINNKIKNSEKAISDLEEECKAIEGQMSDPDFYMKTPNANEIIQKYENLKLEIETKMEAWGEMEEERDKLEKEKKAMS